MLLWCGAVNVKCKVDIDVQGHLPSSNLLNTSLSGEPTASHIVALVGNHDVAERLLEHGIDTTRSLVMEGGNWTWRHLWATHPS